MLMPQRHRQQHFWQPNQCERRNPAHLAALPPKQRIERVDQLPLDFWRWGRSGSSGARNAMFALPARVRTAVDRSSQQIKSAAEEISRRTAPTIAANLVASGIDAA